MIIFELDYETGSGIRYPFTIFFDTGDITTTVTTSQGDIVTRQGGFGNFFGGFDQKKYDIETEKQNIEWSSGLEVIEHDYIPQSEFTKALDQYDDEIYEKEQEEIRKKLEADQIANAVPDASGYQNMFAQFMKANMLSMQQDEKHDEEEQIINGDEEEKQEPETPETLHQKFDFKNSYRYFTDYMQCLVNQRSKIQIPQFSGSFALFHEGQVMLEDNYFLEEITDEFRHLIEKTDNMRCLRL